MSARNSISASCLAKLRTWSEGVPFQLQGDLVAVSDRSGLERREYEKDGQKQHVSEVVLRGPQELTSASCRARRPNSGRLN